MSCSGCVIGGAVTLCNRSSFPLRRTFVLWHVCLTLSASVKANWRRWPGSPRAAANPLSRDHRSLILSTLQRSFKNPESGFPLLHRSEQIPAHITGLVNTPLWKNAFLQSSAAGWIGSLLADLNVWNPEMLLRSFINHKTACTQVISYSSASNIPV